LPCGIPEWAVPRESRKGCPRFLRSSVGDTRRSGGQCRGIVRSDSWKTSELRCGVAGGLRGTAGEEAVTNPDGVEAGLVFLAYLGGLLAAMFEVGVYLGLVPQVVADRRVDVP